MSEKLQQLQSQLNGINRQLLHLQKPRTSPYDFQGLGVEGLKIMKEVADEVGMVTISEIMSPTRNTLDISAVPLLKQETHLPVLVDVSHATGRKDILLSCAKAALAAGADGIMVEVHPNPQAARSDTKQQINIDEFYTFWNGLRDSGFFLSDEAARVDIR
ncbi:MAG: aroG1 [Bacilli bacterium]|nr:aroG1 [Bacilli bacterium]